MENHQKESLRTAKLLASVNNEVQRHVEQQSGQERLESVQHTLTARRERGETNSKRSHAKIEE